MLLNEYHGNEERLPEWALQVVQLLQSSDSAPFVVWLDGPMGAGKTTLVRHIFYAMGLDDHIPVVSPTYTLMQEYEINGKWYAHIDFYRATADFSLEEMGVLDARSFAGIFIEWPDTPPEAQTIPPTHVIKIRPEGDDSRGYQFFHTAITAIGTPSTKF